MRGTLLIEADLDEAVLDLAECDAVMAGANPRTILYSLSENWSKKLSVRSAGPRDEAADAARAKKEEAMLAEHQKSAPASLRQRGVGGRADKMKRLREAQVRVLSDDDIEELLRISAETGKPLNLRGCNLSNVSFRNATLDGACLAYTNLTGADFTGASLARADVQNSWGLNWKGSLQAAGVTAPLREHGFAMTGLCSRGGLSNWTFFVFPQKLVMLDAGFVPALEAGLLSSLDVLTLVFNDPAYGPQPNPKQAWLEFYEQLRAKAKAVIELQDDQIRGLRLHQRLAAHELLVTASRGKPHRFTLMNRHEQEPALNALRQRFGERFSVSSTALFRFVNRHAAFLAK